MDRDAIVVASELITGDDFYNKQYGILFETMVELNDKGCPVDLVTLQDRLREKNVPPEVCGVYQRSDHGGADLGKCKVLCQYRVRKGDYA